MKHIRTACTEKMGSWQSLRLILEELFTPAGEKFLCVNAKDDEGDNKFGGFVQVHSELYNLGDQAYQYLMDTTGCTREEAEAAETMYLVEYRAYNTPTQFDFHHYRAYFTDLDKAIVPFESYYYDRLVDVEGWLDVSHEFPRSQEEYDEKKRQGEEYVDVDDEFTESMPDFFDRKLHNEVPCSLYGARIERIARSGDSVEVQVSNMEVYNPEVDDWQTMGGTLRFNGVKKIQLELKRVGERVENELVVGGTVLDVHEIRDGDELQCAYDITIEAYDSIGAAMYLGKIEWEGDIVTCHMVTIFDGTMRYEFGVQEELH